MDVKRALELQSAFHGAIAVLEGWGWCQNCAVDSLGRHCAIGAIMASSQDVLYEASTYAEQRIYPTYLPLDEWNDLPERKAEDVIALFRQCITDLQKWIDPHGRNEMSHNWSPRTQLFMEENAARKVSGPHSATVPVIAKTRELVGFAVDDKARRAAQEFVTVGIADVE